MKEQGSLKEGVFYGSGRTQYSVSLEGNGDVRIRATGLGGIHEGISNFPAQDIEEIIPDRSSEPPTALIKFRELDD